MAEAPRLRIGAPMVVGAVRLVPVERVTVDWGCIGGRGWITAAREPWALMVGEADGWRVLGFADGPSTLDELRAHVPELDEVLAAL